MKRQATQTTTAQVRAAIDYIRAEHQRYKALADECEAQGDGCWSRFYHGKAQGLLRAESVMWTVIGGKPEHLIMADRHALTDRLMPLLQSMVAGD